MTDLQKLLSQPSDTTVKVGEVKRALRQFSSEDYMKYIRALRQCAKEHENDRTSTFKIRVADLCNDTADLLETQIVLQVLLEAKDEAVVTEVEVSLHGPVFATRKEQRQVCETLDSLLTPILPFLDKDVASRVNRAREMLHDIGVIGVNFGRADNGRQC